MPIENVFRRINMLLEEEKKYLDPKNVEKDAEGAYSPAAGKKEKETIPRKHPSPHPGAYQLPMDPVCVVPDHHHDGYGQLGQFRR